MPQQYTWDIVDSTVVRALRRDRPQRTEKEYVLAAFDMDDTLITPRSGYRFSVSPRDWKFVGNVRTVLDSKVKELESDNCTVIVVVCSNQLSVVPNLQSKSLILLKQKINIVMSLLPNAYMYLAAAGVNAQQYRKPEPRMLEVITSTFGNNINLSKSFFVGDAAGRQGDHSADDKEFAENCNLPFLTIEQFLGEPEPVNKVRRPIRPRRPRHRNP